MKWCTLFETKYTTTLLKQFQATDSTIIIIIIIDYTVKSMITSVTVATRHQSSNQTFDSSFHWRSSFSPHFQNPHYLTLKSWLQMFCTTYTNVENYIKRNIPKKYPNHGLSSKIWYRPKKKKKKLNNKKKITYQSFKLPLLCKGKHYHTFF